MKKKQVTLKNVSEILIKTFTLLLIIYLLHFILILLPKIVSAKRLSESKSGLENARLTLSEYSLLNYRLLSLNPKSITFAESKNEIVSQIAGSITNGQKHFSEKSGKVSSLFADKRSAKLIRSGNDLLASNNTKVPGLIEKQSITLGELNRSQEILSDIFRYDPLSDFSNAVDIEKNKEKASTAISHIEKIREEVASSTLGNKGDLDKDIESVLDALNELYSGFGKTNEANMRSRITVLQNAFYELKLSAYESQKNIIKSEANLQILLEIERIADDHQNLINNISEVQKELNIDPVKVIVAELFSKISNR